MTDAEKPITTTDQSIDTADSPFAEQTAPVDVTEPIEWTASEFIAHDKSGVWYGGLATAAVVLAGIVLLLTHDFISAGVIIFGALLFGVYANRKPRQLPYRLTHHGLDVGQRHYDLHQFRSFSIVPEGVFSSIVLMPLRRFAPLTTIYYAPEDEARIVAVLSQQLPHAEHHPDPVERLMRLIRF